MKILRVTITLKPEDAAAFEHFHAASCFRAGPLATAARFLILQGLACELGNALVHPLAGIVKRSTKGARP